MKLFRLLIPSFCVMCASCVLPDGSDEPVAEPSDAPEAREAEEGDEGDDDENLGSVAEALTVRAPVFDFSNGCGSFPRANLLHPFVGCKIAGRYRDSAGRTFDIKDATTAVIYWQGTFGAVEVGRLRIAGARIVPVGPMSAGAKITVKRRGYSQAGKTNVKTYQLLNGTWNRLPNVPAAAGTITARTFAELCPASGCRTSQGNPMHTRTLTRTAGPVFSFTNPPHRALLPVPGASSNTTLLSLEVTLPAIGPNDTFLLSLAGADAVVAK